MFELKIPKQIQQNINGTEKHLWEELDRGTLYEECNKKEDQILDLGHNAGRHSLYEIIVALCWVMKNINGRLVWEKKEKGENEEQLTQWKKKMVTDSKQLNKKVGIILQGLGLLTPPPPSSVVVQPTARGSIHQGYIPNLPYILLQWSMSWQCCNWFAVTGFKAQYLPQEVVSWSQKTFYVNLDLSLR